MKKLLSFAALTICGIVLLSTELLSANSFTNPTGADSNLNQSLLYIEPFPPHAISTSNLSEQLSIIEPTGPHMVKQHYVS